MQYYHGDLLARFVVDRLDRLNGVTPLRRLELGSKKRITIEEWQYLEATVDEVLLTDPDTEEEYWTLEDEVWGTIEVQQAAGSDRDGEDDWTSEEGTP